MEELGRLPLLSRERDFSRSSISWLQLVLYVQASEFACLPGRSYRCKFPCRAAEAFTSELNVHRYLCTHRICYPPDYRQLAERGLSPRKIHSIVDCSSSSTAKAESDCRGHTDGLGHRSIEVDRVIGGLADERCSRRASHAVVGEDKIQGTTWFSS